MPATGNTKPSSAHFESFRTRGHFIRSSTMKIFGPTIPLTQHPTISWQVPRFSVKWRAIGTLPVAVAILYLVDVFLNNGKIAGGSMRMAYSIAHGR